MPDVMVHASATEPMDMEPTESSAKMELEPKVESSLLADDDLEMELNRTLNEQMSDDKPESSRMMVEPDAEVENEGDNDSLFDGENDDLSEQQGITADGDADGDMDADGEADIDNIANAFGETDADADTDSDGGVGTSNGYGRADPKTAQPQRSAEHDTPPVPSERSASPSKTAERPGGAISLPGRQVNKQDDKKTITPQVPKQATPEAPHPVHQNSGRKTLPKPMFGSMSMAWQYDADVSRFSHDIMLTSTLSGQVMIWDRRVDPKSSKHGVRALALPAGTPPWCTDACWNHTGNKIYVGRRNELVEEWDVRMLPDISTSASHQNRSQYGTVPSLARTLRMPRGSGPVSSVAVLPNNRHIVWCVCLPVCQVCILAY